MPRSRQIRAVAAALLLAGVLYCFYWIYSHGGFYTKAIRIPIHIAEGELLTREFSVPEQGDHYVMITYPLSVPHVWSVLGAVTGEAALNSGDKVIARAQSPFARRRTREFNAIVLFTRPTKAHERYTVSLRITHLPSLLAAAEPALRVELNPREMLEVGNVELLALLMGLTAMLCQVPVVRELRKK